MSGQPIQLTGLSGNSYSFTLLPWSTPLKALGGVYVAISPAGLAQAFNPGPNDLPGRGSVQYVGQTGDLSARPEHHHRERDFARVGVAFVAAAVVPDEQRRRQIEADLIQGLQPPLNRTSHG